MTRSGAPSSLRAPGAASAAASTAGARPRAGVTRRPPPPAPSASATIGALPSANPRTIATIRIQHLLAKIVSAFLPSASGRRNASKRNTCLSPLLRLRCPLEEAPGMLTKRQKELLDFLIADIAVTGYALTLVELGRHMAL